MDKLDGNVDPEMFEHLSADWRKHQDKCLREIHRHQSADQHYLEEGIAVLERHHRSRDGEKHAALVRSRAADGETAAPKFVVSNSTWANGGPIATLANRLDLLQK
jgi:site-specific DNA recombinase